MRLLLDVCIASRTLTLSLKRSGHDVITATSIEPTADDADLIRSALQDNRVLITQDKDFGTLSNLQKLPHGPIIRVVGLTVHEHVRALENLLNSHAEKLTGRLLVTVSAQRIRFRR